MASKERIQEIEEKALELRQGILEMIGIGKAGHLGGSCSCADIVAALYFSKMKINPQNPKEQDRDRFLLSKGHGALVQYAALAGKGFFSKDEFKKVKSIGAMLQGHPDMTKTPGVEANTGSLGQGLSIGAGMALGLKLDGSSRKVYVMLGDGEIAEGQIWEAAMSSANFKLDNLVAILDANGLMSTGSMKERFDLGNINDKWKAFGWHVIEIDGHNVKEILEALDEADGIKDKPTIIIANTVKGKGIAFAKDKAEYHNVALTEAQYELAVQNLI
ncbi:transketolase [Petroclostridium sp. X23]|uniref:transketolase n=1 Tax=Petroclostridium sp. X23 TaxID=3045146 RepID=UPI0024ADF09E|nr:transketolase [Petroclostridium sp. X23]WHH59008.1 transketolase [Petroclostridium sp. X23]